MSGWASDAICRCWIRCTSAVTVRRAHLAPRRGCRRCLHRAAGGRWDGHTRCDARADRPSRRALRRSLRGHTWAAASHSLGTPASRSVATCEPNYSPPC